MDLSKMLHGYLLVGTWIFQAKNMDFYKFLHGFQSLCLWQIDLSTKKLSDICLASCYCMLLQLFGQLLWQTHSTHGSFVSLAMFNIRTNL